MSEHPVLKTPPPPASIDVHAQKKYSEGIRLFTENMWQNERKAMEKRARTGEGINRKASIKDKNNDNMTDIEDYSSDDSTDSEIDLTEDEMKPSAGRDEDSRVKATHQFKHIPYQVESLEEMDSRLDHIIHKLINAAKANDWDISFSIWDHRLQAWLSLKYPMTRERRVQLTRLYYQLLVTPGMDGRFINLFANRLMSLISSKKRISIKDIVLPWKPLYDILSTELFPKQRETSRKNITNNLLTLTEYAQRFFHPSEYQNMLDTILPQMDGSSVDSIISTQAFLVQFLPLSHPQYWLPITFRIWETFNSSHIDDQHLDLVARLTEKHLDPSISDPRFIDSLAPAPSDIPSVGRPPKDKSADSSWKGIRKDIGILTEAQFDTVMQKALSSFNIAVGKLRGGDTLGPDGKISQNVLNLKKPTNRTFSLAIILVYSMSQDAGVAASSAAGTPISETPVNKSKNQLSAPTVGGSSAFNKHLGGSKALDALNKLILNTETYFHPSNWGAHTFALTYFISDTSSLFLERWNDEQKPDCKTPLQWRLTKQMKKEFVHSLRTVALLSMFSKDPISITNTQSCLRNLALLEPDLIYPALMERAYPSLEALTETHRTSAVITALSTVAPHLVSRSKYYAGAKDLLPLLEFSLPGIDMNDPTKTIATCMFIITSLHSVRIGDATSEGSDEVDAHRRKSVNPMDLDGCAPIEVSSPVETSFPEGREANDPPLTPEEADNLIRTSTSSFGDWVIEFFRRVFILCENLPEEGGKHNRVGGRIEESVIHTLMSACEVVCGALSPPIFQLALKQVFQYVSTTTRANSVRVIGQLVSCFAKADAEKTLKQFLGWSISTVKIELHHGASGERTTSTSTPFAGDTSLHWALAVLTGCLSHCGKALLAYKSDIVDILKLTATACKSERGYMWSSSVLQRVLQTLVQYYTTSTRFVNDEEWNSPSFARNHFQHWGRLYEGGDVDVEWHIPSLEEFDMAVELFEQILEPEMKDLDNLSSTSTKSKDWSNDFCRKTLHLRHSLTAIASLLQTEAPDKGREVSDWGEFPQNFVEKQPPFKSQGVLSEDDPRIQYFNQFRFRFGELLHKVARTFTNPNEQNESSDSIDCVKAFLRSLRVFMSENGMDSTHYENTRRRYTFHKSVNKIIPRQKEWPRMTFVRRASYLHATRLHLNTFNRQRSQLDDMLLDDVLELSLSSYTAVRKTAQNTLHQLAVFYDGTKALSMDKILDALKPGVDVDRKKGALFVLMNKSWVSYYLLHFDQFKRTILALLSAQTEEKPSIQNLIQNLSREVVVRMPEINALTSRLKCKQTENVIEKLEKELGGESVDSQELIAEVANAAAGRVEHREELYEELMPQVLEFAESSNTHWRYQLIAQRVLKNLIRRDKPMSERLTRYFLANTISDHPKIREHAYGSITKILHFVKLRTFGQGTNLNEKLLLKNTKNPLKKTVKIEDDASFTTDKYLNQFKQPISDWSSDVLLQDKAQSGWLCWGPSLEVYELPPVNRFPFEWENESSASVQAITETVMSIDWWNKFISQLSIESSSTTPSYDHVNFIKSIFAMSEKPLTLLKTVIEPLLEDVGDRHKQRAASELLSGLLRGVKHWPKYASDDLWSWLTPKLDFLSNVRPDSAATWEVFVINALYHRDPRRLLPLVSWIVNRGDLNRNASSSAWSQAYSINLLRLVVKTVSWRFSAWSAEIGDMYWSFDALNHDYAEVRANIAKTLQKLNRSQLHPSFANVDDLQRVSETVPSDKIIIKHNVEQKTLGHVRNIKKYLAFEYNNRLPPPKSSLSTYDKIGLTILRFIWDALHDSTRCSFYPISIELLPDFFNMRELSDSPDLQATAQSVLSLFAVIPPPREYSEPVVRTLLDVVGSSTVGADDTANFNLITILQRYRVRLHALPITAVFYFFQLPHISQSTTLGVMEELYKLLRDQNIEVRERAAETLSGIVRCSQRSYTLDLKKRFTDTVSAHSLLPRRRMESGEVNSSYAPAVLKLHSGILGICALINAFPYDVPSWMPELLTGVLAEHVSSSDTVISSTIRKTAQDWRRTHQDSWSENIHKFSEEQLSELSSLFLGECYFA